VLIKMEQHNRLVLSALVLISTTKIYLFKTSTHCVLIKI
jgi:hypothetical protein